MANSKYQYTRHFETPDPLLPSTWIVIRIDGRGFHKLSKRFNWTKPNDKRAIELANEAAKCTIREVREVVLAYGQSDEFSFVFPPSTTLFDRRASKLTSTIVSTFTAHYIHLWPLFFPPSTPNTPPLTPPLPTFDARAIVYPTTHHLRDYLSWRQADCHINNLYNTTFWALVQQGGHSAREAERMLKGTVAGDKHEILWRRFGVNYNEVEQWARKGSVLFRELRKEKEEAEEEDGEEKEGRERGGKVGPRDEKAVIEEEEIDQEEPEAEDDQQDQQAQNHQTPTQADPVPQSQVLSPRLSPAPSAPSSQPNTNTVPETPSSIQPQETPPEIPESSSTATPAVTQTTPPSSSEVALPIRAPASPLGNIGGNPSETSTTATTLSETAATSSLPTPESTSTAKSRTSSGNENESKLENDNKIKNENNNVHKDQSNTGSKDELKNRNDAKSKTKRKKKDTIKASTMMMATGNIIIEHVDIIRDDFWNERPWILGNS